MSTTSSPACSWPNTWASVRATSIRPASAACPTSCTCATRWRRSRRACARWRWWPTAAPSCRTARARSAARLRTCACRAGNSSPLWPAQSHWLLRDGGAAAHAALRHHPSRPGGSGGGGARRWAQLNPHAYRREDTSIDEVMASRLIADPLRQRDCCLVTDAGGAFILTTAERARSLRRPPVHVLGIAESFRITTRRSILPTGSTPTWRRRRTRRWRWPASRARTSTWCRSMTTSPSA